MCVINEEKGKLNEINYGYDYSHVKDFFLRPINYYDVEKGMQQLSKDFIVSALAQYTDEKGMQLNICILSTKENKEVEIPIVEGRNINKNKKKEVVIGKELKKELGDIKTINIGEEEYEICGVAGRENEESIFDKRIIFYLENIGEKTKKYIDKAIAAGDGSFNCIKIVKETKVTNEDTKKAQEVFGKKDGYILVEQEKNEIVKNSEVKSLVEKKEDIFGERILIFIAIENVIIASTFWIIDRKKEISIRKAFGAQNINIVGILFKELSILVLISLVLSVGIQWILLFAFKSSFYVNISFSTLNIIGFVLVGFLLSILASAIPIWRALKVEVIQGLKE